MFGKGSAMQNNYISFAAKMNKNTIYIIENSIGGKAKETAYDKVKRLIMNKPIIFEKQVS